MNSFEEYVNWLTKYLEEKELKEIYNYAEITKQSYYCDLAPKNSNGNPATDASARPTVIISISKDNEFAELRWIYLNKRRLGIGMKIVNKFIQLCKNIRIKKLYFCSITSQEGINFISKIGYDEETGLNTYVKYIHTQ